MSPIVRQRWLGTLWAAINGCVEMSGLYAQTLWRVTPPGMPRGRFFKSIFPGVGGTYDHVSDKGPDPRVRAWNGGLSRRQVANRKSLSARSGLLRLLGAGLPYGARREPEIGRVGRSLKSSQVCRSVLEHQKVFCALRPLFSSLSRPLFRGATYDIRQFLDFIASSIDWTLPFETARSPSLSPPVALEIGIPTKNTPIASPVCALLCASSRSSSRSFSCASSFVRLEHDWPVYAAKGMLAGLIASGPLAQPAITSSPAERVAIVFKVILPPVVILPEVVR